MLIKWFCVTYFTAGDVINVLKLALKVLAEFHVLATDNFGAVTLEIQFLG